MLYLLKPVRFVVGCTPIPQGHRTLGSKCCKTSLAFQKVKFHQGGEQKHRSSEEGDRRGKPLTSRFPSVHLSWAPPVSAANRLFNFVGQQLALGPIDRGHPSLTYDARVFGDAAAVAQWTLSRESVTAHMYLFLLPVVVHHPFPPLHFVREENTTQGSFRGIRRRIPQLEASNVD